MDSNLKRSDGLINSVGSTIPVKSIAFGNNTDKNNPIAGNSRNIPTESTGLLFFQFYSYNDSDNYNGDNGTPRIDFRSDKSDVVASLNTNNTNQIILSSSGESLSLATTVNPTNLNLILFDFE